MHANITELSAVYFILLHTFISSIMFHIRGSRLIAYETYIDIRILKYKNGSFCVFIYLIYFLNSLRA